MRECPLDGVLISFDNRQHERASRNEFKRSREPGKLRLRGGKMLGHVYCPRGEEQKRYRSQPFHTHPDACGCKNYDEQYWQNANVEIRAFTPHPGNRPEQNEKKRSNTQPPVIPAKLGIAPPGREKPNTESSERNQIKQRGIAVQDHPERIKLFPKSVKDNLLHAQADPRRVQIKRHNRQCKRAAPEPVANGPLIERKICHYHEPSDTKSEQMREIQHGERRERCNPRDNARLRKPSQPKSERKQSNRKA